MAGGADLVETCVGALRQNNLASNRKKRTGCAPVGQAAIFGMQDRRTGTFDADVVARTGKPMLQEHVPSQMATDATVYADDNGSNGGMPNRRHERVRNNAGNYLRGMPTRMVRKAYGPSPSVCTRASCARSVRISCAGTGRMVGPPSGRPLDRKDQRRRTAADTVGR